MVLRIDRVFPQHFRHYYFQAHNKAGTDEVKLTLDRRGQLMQSIMSCLRLGGINPLMHKVANGVRRHTGLTHGF